MGAEHVSGKVSGELEFRPIVGGTALGYCDIIVYLYSASHKQYIFPQAKLSSRTYPYAKMPSARSICRSKSPPAVSVKSNSRFRSASSGHRHGASPSRACSASSVRRTWTTGTTRRRSCRIWSISWPCWTPQKQAGVPKRANKWSLTTSHPTITG